MLSLICAVHSEVKIYQDDPAPNAETIVVEVTATETYENEDGELVNVVPHAQLARQVLKAIQPRLEQAIRNHEHGVITELTSIKMEMESMLKQHSGPGSVVTSKPKIYMAESTKLSSPATPTAKAILSPSANIFALCLLILFITVFIVFSGMFLCYVTRMNAVKTGRSRRM